MAEIAAPTTHNETSSSGSAASATASATATTTATTGKQQPSRPHSVTVEWMPQETQGDQRPGPCWGHSAVILPESGDILVLGGTSLYMQARAQVWRLDVSARRWHDVDTTDCPPLSAHTASVVPGIDNQPARVVCFGGDGPVPPDSSPCVLDTGSWRWSPLSVASASTQKPQWRRTHSSVVRGQDVWIIGGASEVGFLDDMWTLNMSVRFHERWVKVTDDLLPTCFSRRANHSSTLVDGDKIYIFGGFNGAQMNDLFVIDPTAVPCVVRMVRTAGAAPLPRSGHAAVAVPNPSPSIIFVGGEFRVDTEFYDDMQIFDIERQTWAIVDIIGRAQWAPRGWCTACWSHNAPSEVFVFGGGTYHNFLDDLSVIDLETLQSPPLEVCPVGRDLGCLLCSGVWSDAILESADGGRFHAHKAILAARSPVFQAMLDESKWGPGEDGVFFIGHSEAALDVFLRFVYTGCCNENMTATIALEVLDLAAQYLLDPLVRSCGQQLAHILRDHRIRAVKIDSTLLEGCRQAASQHSFTLRNALLAREVERSAAFAEEKGYSPLPASSE